LALWGETGLTGCTARNTRRRNGNGDMTAC